MSKARAEVVRREEAEFGPRKDKSRRASIRTFARATEIMRDHLTVVLDTDKKSTYPAIARVTFGEERLLHTRTDGGFARDTWNPLLPINQTEAMLRGHLGRLQRRSWLVSKRGWCLNLALHMFIADRNFVRRRFNSDGKRVSTAQVLGLVDRRMTVNELLSWRQDWRGRSIVPGAVSTYSVESWKAAAA